jgi:hypothetical protein
MEDALIIRIRVPYAEHRNVKIWKGNQAGHQGEEGEKISILVICHSFSDVNDPNGFNGDPASRRRRADERAFYLQRNSP